MTCRECDAFLLEYVAGELDRDTLSTFELHLLCCRNCRIYVEQYAATVKAGQSAFASAPLPDMPEELVRAILAARRTKPLA